ncbi:hypothetical protein, partial [Acinetobacter baumannii]|uniref:hypothetical protein n=1 Tax=Acinetobacter baumannii TaxID=470 RepID=UPI0013D17246
STLRIGAANLGGAALALDTSGNFAVADAAALSAQKIAIGGGAIQFNASADMAGQAGVIGAGLEVKLAAAPPGVAARVAVSSTRSLKRCAPC